MSQCAKGGQPRPSPKHEAHLYLARQMIIPAASGRSFEFLRLHGHRDCQCYDENNQPGENDKFRIYVYVPVWKSLKAVPRQFLSGEFEASTKEEIERTEPDEPRNDFQDHARRLHHALDLGCRFWLLKLILRRKIHHYKGEAYRRQLIASLCPVGVKSRSFVASK
jgi:hypothetical protein